MANGPYSPSGGYRNDRGRDEQDHSRQPSERSGRDGNVRGFADYQRDVEFGGRDERDRSTHDQTDRDRGGRDDYGQEGSFSDSDQARGWARESYRANPSSFTYEPDRARPNPVPRDRYASGVDGGSDAGRYGTADRHGTDRYGSSNSDNYGSGDRTRSNDGQGERRGLMERAGDEVASWFGDDKASQRRDMDQHRGKGPKGYQRSDTRIEEDINDRLSDDPILDASNISVTVAQAEVTLDGFVSSRWDKRRAEDLVEDISGVRHVQNNLRVNNSMNDTLGGSTTV
ncbi:BON domain-containing protein [Neorhizobium lilium]|uniref:BON domain-containing protein n=1 Tax=Neorhizobium lilium TaxID=2503024 RepID=A0A444LJV6_9HYPH|nr:BON domain-containing protein [Neorhizobium lilium]RWX79280.1 BON domain-containing protein [Neorhizobium lilium]